MNYELCPPAPLPPCLPMLKEDWLLKLKQHRAIAVIRAPRFEVGIQMARAVAAGGIRLIEITWNSDRAIDLIGQLRSVLPDCVIGVGTLLTLEDLQRAIAAGAEFCFTPHTNLTLIQAAVNRQIPIIPGALSSTEIVTAWQAGAACVKVFPAASVGGASYIRALQGPLGQIPLIPTGGVTVENTKDFLAAGAIAVGLSSSLFPKTAVVQGDWSVISDRAKVLLNEIASI